MRDDAANPAAIGWIQQLRQRLHRIALFRGRVDAGRGTAGATAALRRRQRRDERRVAERRRRIDRLRTASDQPAHVHDVSASLDRGFQWEA